MAPKRVTNAQVAELMTRVEVALQPHPPTPEPSTMFLQEDHDALVTLVTKMDTVEKAAKRWDANHTVVSNLKQRVGLLSWAGGLLTIGAVGEIVRRAFDYFTK